MDISILITRLIIGTFIVISVTLSLWFTGRPLFMSQEKFEEYLKKKTRFTRILFPNYKPSIILNRIVYLFSFILAIIVFIAFIFAIILSWL